MEYQVRRYEIKPGHMADFVNAWREGVLPLRESVGFEVVGAWVIEDTNEFVWILGYDGPDGFAAADAAYYSMPERASLVNDPRQYILSPNTHMADRVV